MWSNAYVASLAFCGVRYAGRAPIEMKTCTQIKGSCGSARDCGLCACAGQVQKTLRELPLVAEPGELEVLYQDQHVIAVNKPGGMQGHPASRLRGGSLLNRVAHHLGSEPHLVSAQSCALSLVYPTPPGSAPVESCMGLSFATAPPPGPADLWGAPLWNHLSSSQQDSGLCFEWCLSRLDRAQSRLLQGDG